MSNTQSGGLSLTAGEAMGHIVSVDSSSVCVQWHGASAPPVLVNDLIAIQSPQCGQFIIGTVLQSIAASNVPSSDSTVDLPVVSPNFHLLSTSAAPASAVQHHASPSALQVSLKVLLIGTFEGAYAKLSHVAQPAVQAVAPLSFNYMLNTLLTAPGGRFSVTLPQLPALGASCIVLHGRLRAMLLEQLKQTDRSWLDLGTAPDSDACSSQCAGVGLVHGSKFLQRHAMITGSTGSGKSWLTALLLEKAQALPSVNCLLFDLHGEYASLQGRAYRQLFIAGPLDAPQAHLSAAPQRGTVADDAAVSAAPLFLPLWLLPFEDIRRVILGSGHSENSAVNQVQFLRQAVLRLRQRAAALKLKPSACHGVTVDMPYPFSIATLQEELSTLHDELAPSDKVRRQAIELIKLRLADRAADPSLRFMFTDDAKLQAADYALTCCHSLFGSAREGRGGIKIIDCSKLSTPAQQLAITLICRLAFEVHRRMPSASTAPVALFCDEAQLYMAEGGCGSHIFARIAKEGRKYGLSLVVVTQRPADISPAIRSQCSNWAVMRLSSSLDQKLLREQLPAAMAPLVEDLPYFAPGEVLFIGDASLIPGRVQLQAPSLRPLSVGADLWQCWQQPRSAAASASIQNALNCWLQTEAETPAIRA